MSNKAAFLLGDFDLSVLGYGTNEVEPFQSSFPKWIPTSYPETCESY